MKTSSLAALKVIFALLTHRGLVKQTYREIMAAAGVSLGSVQNVIGDLVHRGIISEKSDEGRSLITPRRLIDEWVSQYITVRPRLVLQRFSPQTPNWWKNVRLPHGHVFWGGEIAAAKLIRTLEPGTATLYSVVNQNIINTIIQENRLHADEQGTVEILQLFWKTSAEDTAPAPGTNDGITAPLLIYADLLASLDARNREVAKQIYDNYLQNLYD
jgi:hypothetical protein